MQTTTEKVKQLIKDSINELQGEQHDKILASACIVCLNVLWARLNLEELEREEIETYNKYYQRGKIDQLTKMPVDFIDAFNMINCKK
jgi:hypothetical protein